MEKDFTRHRLYPRQPEEMPYVCFYPMNKRRNVGQNWYTQTLGERARLMQEHDKTGRAYVGKVSQIISGSVGLDDWEWAVTHFSHDPLQFKELVTEMRYDEVTSVYGEFGALWVGHRVAAGELGGGGWEVMTIDLLPSCATDSGPKEGTGHSGGSGQIDGRQ